MFDLSESLIFSVIFFAHNGDEPFKDFPSRCSLYSVPPLRMSAQQPSATASYPWRHSPSSDVHGYNAVAGGCCAGGHLDPIIQQSIQNMLPTEKNLAYSLLFLMDQILDSCLLQFWIFIHHAYIFNDHISRYKSFYVSFRSSFSTCPLQSITVRNAL